MYLLSLNGKEMKYFNLFFETFFETKRFHNPKQIAIDEINVIINIPIDKLNNTGVNIIISLKYGFVKFE